MILPIHKNLLSVNM